MGGGQYRLLLLHKASNGERISSLARRTADMIRKHVIVVDILVFAGASSAVVSIANATLSEMPTLAART